MPDAVARDLSELIRGSAEPLPEFDDDRFAARYGDARVVCRGDFSVHPSAPV
jgi:hypothetical protein